MIYDTKLINCLLCLYSHGRIWILTFDALSEIDHVYIWYKVRDMRWSKEMFGDGQASIKVEIEIYVNISTFKSV
jgi:hypothetical protein